MQERVLGLRSSGCAIAAATAIAATVSWIGAWAQSVPLETLKMRWELALFVLQAGDDQVADTRVDCASGAWSRTVAEQRAEGRMHTADAADTCVVALTRTAKDQRLLDLYRRVVSESSGDPAIAPALPAAIGAAVTKAKAGTVAVGNQRGAKITSALALDAGYTVGQQQDVRYAQGMPDLQILKTIAERCLAQAESNMALCYSTGYVYAARALSQLSLVP